MHFRHISAKIQPKNLKQHFDWRARAPRLRPYFNLFHMDYYCTKFCTCSSLLFKKNS